MSNNVSNFDETVYNEAINDFLDGNGSGIPDTNHCEYLMKYNKAINNKILKSLEKNKKSISIMPYGENIMFAEDATYSGPYTRNMYVEKDGHRMEVYFDRN